MKTTIYRLSALAPAVAVVALSSAAVAGGVPITPGLWEMNTRATVFGETQNEVERRCITADRLDPVTLLQETEGCSAENVVVDDTSMSFDQICASVNGEVTGHFTFDIDGKEGSGTGEMTMSMGGVEMDLSYDTVMTRVGDC